MNSKPTKKKEITFGDFKVMKHYCHVIFIAVFLMCFGCDKLKVIPFDRNNKEESKTISTNCGNIILQLRRLGSLYLYVSLNSLSSTSNVEWQNMRILVNNKEIEYDFYQKEYNIYEFYISSNEGMEAFDITFQATSFIMTETDTCGFSAVNVKYVQ